MSDTKAPDLLVPDRRVVSIDEAKQDRAAKKAGAPASPTAFLTKRELFEIVLPRVNDGISAAAIAVGQKMFDQVTEETSEMLAQMEHTLRQEFMAELYRRSVRGRCWLAWSRTRDWARGYLIEMGVCSPMPVVGEAQLVDEDEATEGTTQTHVGKAELTEQLLAIDAAEATLRQVGTIENYDARTE